MASDAVRHNTRKTGSIKLDLALGGGFVGGKIIELYGKESSGKTTMAYAFLSKQQGVLNGFIDAETSFDPINADMCGVDRTKLMIHHPDYMEEGQQMTLDMIETGGVKNIVFDSLTGVGPLSEMEGGMTDTTVGKAAYKSNQMMRKLHGVAGKNDACVLFINQIRSTVGVMYGPPTTTTGGHGLKFYASYRLSIKKVEPIEVGASKDRLGHYMHILIVKNKFGTPGGVVTIPLIYGHGISREWEIMDLGEEYNVIEKSGSWYSYENAKLGQGQAAVFGMLVDNPELTDEIEIKIHERASKT